MVGLPRSGKSTAAKKLGYPIVEPDAIRQVMHGTHWRAEIEPLIWGIADLMVRSLFAAGHENVILDAVNHTDERRRKWLSPDWCVRFHVIDTPVSECITRAKTTKQEYLIPIIERMGAQWQMIIGDDC